MFRAKFEVWRFRYHALHPTDNSNRHNRISGSNNKWKYFWTNSKKWMHPIIDHHTTAYLMHWYKVGSSTMSSELLLFELQMEWTFSTAAIVGFSSSCFKLWRCPRLNTSHTLAAYASKYIYLDLCSGFNLLPGLNRASINSSENIANKCYNFWFSMIHSNGVCMSLSLSLPRNCGALISSTGGGSFVEYILNNTVISAGFKAFRDNMAERAWQALG